MTKIKIIGFDLGHGETSLSEVGVDNQDSSPKSLSINGKKSQITAIAYHPERGILIGEKACKCDNVTIFEIGFKNRQFNQVTFKKNIKEFVNTIYKNLIDVSHIQKINNNRFVIGCPSGWSQEERESYKQLLAACLPNEVTVVKESRAAFMEAKESNLFDIKQLQESLLVIDIGSSTTDYTIVNSMSDNPIDFGYNLGASLIDKEILKTTLECHRQYREGREEILRLREVLSDEEILQLEEISELENIFEQEPVHKNRCELKCRKAKEEYFFDQDDYEENNIVNCGTESIQRKYKFLPLVNGKTMSAILNQPLAELGNKSWSHAFRDNLQAVKQKLVEQDIQPSAILLTGGPSKMSFVLEICKEIFPDASCKKDGEPELTIAKGLARCGRVDIRIGMFMEEIKQLLDCKLTYIVENHLPTVFQQLAEELANGLVEEVIKTQVQCWRNREIIRLTDLESAIEETAKAWLTGDDANSRMTTCLGKWLKTIQDEVIKETNSIFEKYTLSFRTFDKTKTEMNDHTGKVPTSILLGDFTGVSMSVGHLVGLIVTVVLVGLCHFLIFGIVAAIILGIISFFVGESFVMDIDIPAFIRKQIVTDQKIDELAYQHKPQLEEKILETLTEDRALSINLKKRISESMKKTIEKVADEARFLIF